MIVTIEKMYVFSIDDDDWVPYNDTDVISGDYEVREYPTASKAYCATADLRGDYSFEVCYFKNRRQYEDCCVEWDMLPYYDSEVIHCA